MTHRKQILLCWHAQKAGTQVLEGAVANLAKHRVRVDRVLYLVQAALEVPTVGEVRGVPVEVRRLNVADPTNHTELIETLRNDVLPFAREMGVLHVNISPGTPAMHAVWLILHAAGDLPRGTTIWASQRAPGETTPTLQRVKFTISTYLQEVRDLAAAAGVAAVYDPETATSPARRAALERILRYARLGAVPMLVLGERGTGKTRLAETAIRAAKGRDRPFVVVPCGSMDSGLVDSALFGHAAGAFTGAKEARDGLIASARGGTLFLDEVQDLPRSAQRKLVRVLEERRFRRVGEDVEREADIQVVCASNHPFAALGDRVDSDLLDRISHLIVEVPPLRECRSDLRGDWQRVWSELRLTAAAPPVAPWSDALADAVNAHPLPGNFRDLQRLAALTASWLGHHGVDTESAVRSAIDEWRRWTPSAPPGAESFAQGPGHTREEQLAHFKRDLALRAKERWGTWELAAEKLDCGERTLRRDASPESTDRPGAHERRPEVL